MGERAVGWCHAAPRKAIPRLEVYPEFRVDDSERVGSIVCFVVAEAYRGRGIARSLLRTAYEEFGRQGFAFVEAYPRKQAECNADNYRGPLKMYLDAGFTVFRELERHVMVRRRL